jgi:hypothetical protein
LEQEAKIHFKRALSYLEDIQRLSEENVSPLIRQAIYSFQQSNTAHLEYRPLLSDFPQVLFFWKSFTENLKQRLLERRDLENVELLIESESLPLKQVEVLSKCLPSFIDVLCCLTFKEFVTIECREEQILAKGKIQLCSELENRRIEIYRLTRWFLKQGMILTFSHGSILNDETEMTLKLRLPDLANQVALLDFEKKGTPLVGLSPIIADYKVSSDAALRLGRHLCIEITEDLNVEKYYRLPRRVLNEKSSTEIMHFAFLFRPVSFIIPRRSRLTKVDDRMMLGGTGRGISTAQQEVDESNRGYFFIDILSLMSC